MSPIETRKTPPVAASRAVPERGADRTELPGRPAAQTPAPGVRIELGDAAADRTAPVDHERVAQIREALRDGTYPIVPARIADALIAARLTLGGQV